MQNTDTVTAWRRAARTALRSLGRTGMLHPTPLLCFGMFLLLGGAAVSLQAASAFRRSLAEQARVVVELQPSAGDSDVQEFYAGVQAVTGVAGAELVSKEQALTRQREAYPDLAAFLDRYQLQNPFADAFVIRLRSAGGFAALRTFVEEDRWAALLDRSTPAALAEQQASLLRLQGVVDALGRAAALLTNALLLIALFLLADITWSRLSHRAAERTTAALLGGGWVESDGTVLLEVLFMLWAALAAAAAALAALSVTLPAFFGADASVAAFVQTVRGDALAALPSMALSAAALAPVAALAALGLARLVPARRLG